MDDDILIAKRTLMKSMYNTDIIEANLGPASLDTKRYPKFDPVAENKVLIEIRNCDNEILSSHESEGLFFYLFSDGLAVPCMSNIVRFRDRGFDKYGYNRETDTCWFEEPVMENYNDEVTPSFKIIVKLKRDNGKASAAHYGVTRPTY